MAPLDESDPAAAAVEIIQELERFSPTLAARPRWLVLNKSDLIEPETFAARRQQVLAALNWQGPVYEVAAINGTGTKTLCGDLMRCIEELNAAEAADETMLQAEYEAQARMQQEARDRIEALRAARAAARRSAREDDIDDDDDVAVEYRH